MPNQWATIAPIIGRTPAQCVEHYNYLSDMALDSGASMVDPADDPRRLKPGEIDPQPETKPARPDPVDMAEDEKEMLQEARARLANTKGKKAKRKAREKHLEEARRLAQTQKMRELRAAGIELKPKKKKKDEIDDSKEIRNYHHVPMGEFDVSEEQALSSQARDISEFIGRDINELDGGNKYKREQEERERDAKRERLHKQTNLPAVIQRLNAMDDPVSIRPRGTFALPKPQVTETDLEVLAKEGVLSSVAQAAATARTPIGLMGPPSSSSTTSSSSSLSSREAILQDMRNIIALNSAQTPLQGGENAIIAPTTFSGHKSTAAIAASRAESLRTPSAIALAAASRTPMPHAAAAAAAAGVGSKRSATTAGLAAADGTGSRATTGAGVPMTPFRDEFGNMSSVPSAAGAAAAVPKERDARVAMLQQAMAARKRLRVALGSLPEAENEYALVWPSLPDDVAAVAAATPAVLSQAPVGYEEDAEALLRADAAERKAAELAAEQRKPQVLQKGLPRPRQVNIAMGTGVEAALRGVTPIVDEAKAVTYSSPFPYTTTGSSSSSSTTGRSTGNDNAAAIVSSVKTLIASEMLSMLRRDAASAPVDGSAANPKRVASTAMTVYSDSLLANAKSLVDAEVKKRPSPFGTVIPNAALDSVFDEVAQAIAFLPTAKRFGWLSSESLDARLAALRQEAQLLRAHRDAEADKANKLEQQLKVLHGGYEIKLKKLRQDIATAFSSLEKATVNHNCFTNMLDRERAVRIPQRLAEMRARVAEQAAIDKWQQAEYARLTNELEELVQNMVHNNTNKSS